MMKREDGTGDQSLSQQDTIATMNDTPAPPSQPKRSPAIRFLALVVLVLGFYWFVTRHEESNLPWLRDFDAAVAAARDRNAPILIDFWASWCGPCLSFDATVLSAGPVEDVAAREFVLFRVDLSDQPPKAPDADIAARYGITGIPALLVVEPDNLAVIARASDADKASPSAFADFLRRHSKSP